MTGFYCIRRIRILLNKLYHPLPLSSLDYSLSPRFSEVTPVFGGDPHVAAEGGLAYEGQQGKAEEGQGHEEGPRQVANGQGFDQGLRPKFEKSLLVRPYFKAQILSHSYV